MSNPKTADRVRFDLSAARGVPIEYDLSAYRTDVTAIQAIDLVSLGDAELRLRARRVRETLRPGATEKIPGSGTEYRDTATKLPDDVVAEIFALSREASRRYINLEPYELQIIAALAMARGRLVQMQTGEGKTLAAALAVSACAVFSPGVHVMTANDYLAARDARWMAPLYEFWGLSVAAIAAGDRPSDRRKAYGADITYLTAKEAGFDYLRDQLAYRAEDRVQRDLNMVLVDEADFILIDESRVPLVIAGPSEPDGVDPRQLRDMVAQLVPGKDFNVDVRNHAASFTIAGLERLEALLDITGMHDVDSSPVWARLHAALHAQTLVRKDRDYIVSAGSVRLVDEFTGRVAEMRRWPWGIQSAVEAIEDVPIQDEGRVYGSITIQHFINLYSRRAAMTATALPSAREFQEFYGLTITLLPPAKPLVRIDEPDRVFADRSGKYASLIDRIRQEHDSGRPVLVGTASVAESVEIAAKLGEHGIACKVLNAANDFEEAPLIAAAGRLNAVTISTNMAGRGTDIRLALDGSSQEYERVRGLGGLLVLATNRNESKRIDDQLRGRSGRQGEPGASAFYVSLEDPLFEKYGVREFLPPDLEDPRTQAELDRAQRLIETENNDIRRLLRKYSMLVEFDRRYVRAIRDDALISRVLPDFAEAMLGDLSTPRTVTVPQSVATPRLAAAPQSATSPRPAAIQNLLVRIFLYHLDRFWSDHLSTVDAIREGIHMVQYGGREPGREFNRHVADAFETGFTKVGELTRDSWQDLCRTHGLAKIENMSDAEAESLVSGTGFVAPSSTWTYLVSDAPMPGYKLSMIASSNMGTAALAGPLVALVDWVGKLFGKKGRS